jgi:hypothetical protein
MGFMASDLVGGSGGMAGDEFAAHGGQPAEDGVTQSVAQKLAAGGAGKCRMSVHVSAISKSIRHPGETGLSFFAQALTFLGLLNP